MDAKLFRVILPVSDIEQATRFYRAVLSDDGKRVSNGRHYFNCGGTILACFDPRADGDDHEPTPIPDHLYFAVEDIAAAYERCEKARATFSAGDVHGDPAGEIHARPWGERSFYVEDPFGNRLCFVEKDTMFTGGE